MTAPEAPTQEQPLEGTCPRCGAPLQPGQDWCLSCGMAVTTHVAGAPGWRTPVAIVAAVLALAAAGLVIAFFELSDDAEREVAQAPTPAASPAPTGDPAPTPSPAPEATPAPGGATGATGATGPTGTPSETPTPSPTTPGSGGFASWPAGRTAFTVILASETSRDAAESKARSFQSSGGSVGILDSDDFKSLRGGYHVVFSGQYDDEDAAEAAAESFGSSAPDAYVRRIEPK